MPHSEVLRVRISTYPFSGGGDAIQLLIPFSLMTRYFSYLIFILVYQSFAIFSLPSGFKLFCFFVLRMSLINSIKLGFRLQSPSPCLVQGKLTLYVFTVTLDVIRIILICILFLFCFAFLLFPSPSGLCWNGKVLSL